MLDNMPPGAAGGAAVSAQENPGTRTARWQLPMRQGAESPRYGALMYAITSVRPKWNGDALRHGARRIETAGEPSPPLPKQVARGNVRRWPRAIR
jgi:hypothetical protein